jgi:hypothetical protein
MIDFGFESVFSIKTPIPLQPKLLKTIIKFKLTNSCCSKAIIAGNEFTTMRMYELILEFYGISADKAFTTD